METKLCVIGIVVLAVLLLVLGLVAVCQKIAFGKRCEGNPNFRYFKPEDFEGLSATPVEVPLGKKPSAGVLRGYTYTRGGDKGVIVFSHGMGAGHFAYTAFINDLCKLGYTVVATDNRGTVLSDGKATGDPFEGAVCLTKTLQWVGDSDLAGQPLFLVGHSMGASSVCRVLDLGFPVLGAVSLSAFDSERKVVSAMAGAMTNPVVGKVIGFLITLGNLVDYGVRAVKPVTNFVEKSGVPVLAYHGSADQSVPVENSVAKVSRDKELKNVTSVFLPGRGHNPYQTAESEQFVATTFAQVSDLLKEYGGTLPKVVRDNFFKGVDEWKLVESDPQVLKRIDEFFDSCHLKQNTD